MKDLPFVELEPYGYAAARQLETELGVSHVVAQVLARRGYGDSETAQAFLASEERHDFADFDDIDRVVELVAQHIQNSSKITVYGDYDVDGVCATAVMVSALRRAGASVDSFIPSRADDGYGLSLEAIERLQARGTQLLITVDCGITAVEEVAHARSLGIDVIVTDHHAPRADGKLPDVPIVHPVVCGYPFTELCGTAVAYRFAQAVEVLLELDPASKRDLELVALATVADVVPLLGENRYLVREGLRALSTTTRPGLLALMAAASVDPSGLESYDLAFKLAPRINAAGRLYHADAGLELLLTDDRTRADEIAAELNAANAERRDVEMKIRFEAEAQVKALGERSTYVLAGEGWHPGVIGIVASRIAERHCRPTIMIALDGERGSGSGRSIPGFDLLAGLDACAELLERHGGHRAAAGLTITREQVEQFRERFEFYAAERLSPEDLTPRVRADAVVSGTELSLELVEELRELGPFGAGNPAVELLLPAARFHDPETMGEGKHLRFTVESAGRRSRAVLFGSGRLPVPEDEPTDATFALERNQWNGTVEARLLLRKVCRRPDLEIKLLGEPDDYLGGAFEELNREPIAELPEGSESEREPIDSCEVGIAAGISDLHGTGESLLLVTADALRRQVALRSIAHGCSLIAWDVLERKPELARDFTHVAILDPPLASAQQQLSESLPGSGFTHLIWGESELEFAQRVHAAEYDLRPALTQFYRTLQSAGQLGQNQLERALKDASSQPHSTRLAGRVLRVLGELGLIELDRDSCQVKLISSKRTDLLNSAAYQAYHQRYEDGNRCLKVETEQAA